MKKQPTKKIADEGIQQIDIVEIKPYELNAKKHPTKQVKQIAESIKKFGFNQPIVTDKDNVIIVGHGRYQAAKLLGLAKVPVVQLKNITDEDAKAYRIADNKLNESEWEKKLLIQELRELDLAGFDITLTGFTRDIILQRDDRDDYVPEVTKSTSKKGDMYQLGAHTLMCGDATDTKDMEKLMGGIQADLILTDPPYNVDYSGTGKKTSNKIMNDKMGDQAFQNFLDAVFKNYASVSKKGTPWYVFHSPKTQDIFGKAIQNSGWNVKTQIIWVKPMATLGMNEYRSQHEPLFYAVKNDSKAPFYGDRTHTTIWKEEPTDQKILEWAKKQIDHDITTTIWKVKRDNFTEYVHPTQKPVEILLRAIANSSKEGDIVLDVFGGSGSTLIACEKAGRVSKTMELDPIYVDTIIARWEEYTGQRATKI